MNPFNAIRSLWEKRSSVSGFGRQIGISPPGGISLSKLKEYYLTNPAAKAAVDHMVAQLTGSGHYIVSTDEQVPSRRVQRHGRSYGMVGVRIP